MSDETSPVPHLERFRRIRARAVTEARESRPVAIEADHPLAKALGVEEAIAILSHRAARRQIIATRVAQGVSNASIARELDVTPTRITQLRKAMGI